ncbi:MATE family efflux transporter [Thermococcus sp. M39]|uniref:MATE family efflux transporter n=1 Tax=unclassified Thermococcus TaxID=2627626 RepID=UPI001439F2B3|nr:MULTISPECIES: MATE family efflux transporter [unclassified Thermococcus]NJE07056.1 MATE family efflux transporter [Thermococcus sp. M39]NJE13594.1 MATE family efflux transporter [Thermococcus sp. LS2]
MNDERIHEMRREIVEGNIERTLLKLAYPLIINNMVQVLYNLTDTFWLGRLGREELSAPGTAWPLVWFFMSIGMGFATAGFAFVSQYIGAKRYDKANKAAGALYSLMMIFAVLIALLGLIITPYALRFMRVTPEVYPFALNYIRVIFIGIPFSFTLFAFNFLLRAVGDTKTPVKINMLTVFLNIVLDPLLIFGWFGFPKLGVVGAAVATMFSNSVGSIIGGYLLFTGKVGIHLTLENLKPDWNFYARIFRVGLPSSIGFSTDAFGFIVLTRIIYYYGTVAFATYTIANRLTNFMFAIANGISQAMGTMVGQNVGAEKYERAKKIAEKAMLTNFIILSIGTLIVVMFRPQIFGAFINDAAVLAESAVFVKYFAFSLPFFGILAAVSNVFQSSGHTKKSMVLGMLRLWVLRIPLAYWLGKLTASTVGVWLGMGLSNVVSALVALAWFLKGSWMRRIIDH